MRGGTSKGLFFRWDDLPARPCDRDAFLCGAIGAPDPNGRQLDGMGGGISSLSKAMMVRRSSRDNVDIDYLFAQVAVREAVVDYGGNCGNLSAAVGAFAVDQGLVDCADGPALVRMYNENTGKRLDCRLDVLGGRSVVCGAQGIAGVAGQGAPVHLDFLQPGGSRTGALLPLGTPMTHVHTEGSGSIPYSVVDAANPCVFVSAPALGLTGTEAPADISAMEPLMAWLEALRRSAGALAGLSDDPETVPESVPKIALVGRPAPSRTLSSEVIAAEDCDVQIRMISMGTPHLAIPLTGAMCTAVAARIPGTVVAAHANAIAKDAPLRIGTPSGVVPATADVNEVPVALNAGVYRTQRTLMQGTVFAPIAKEPARK